MPRPKAITELHDYLTKGKAYIEVDLGHLTVDLAVGAAVLDLVQALRTSDDVDVVEEGGQIVATIPRTEAELDAALTQAQSGWDAKASLYRKAAVDPDTAKGYTRTMIDQWAAAEGLPAIEWPEA